MTKRREPLTFHRALTVIAARIGWDKCAMLVGRSERLVRMWSDPDADSEISIIDALRLDGAFIAAGGDHGPFHRVFTTQLELAARDGTSADLAFAAANAARESGEAISALIEAATCRDPAKRRAARREAEEAIEALTDGIAALDRHEVGEA
ncbi:hypothetical protein [Novosphingobium sp.]|uniref:hypothetical protein n=1 Tax=Novosphingobium sp. TaxID=1874826 RepID=UPI001D8D33F1|nr:hypothetical protein [Novosphingobium sp.]MBX9661905.1 hypothetical protein [Novosphingobium sp.]